MFPDGGPPPPMGVLAAWTDAGGGTFTAAALDLGCVGMARTDTALAAASAYAATVDDFQTGSTVPNATVTAFAGHDPTATLATATADANGHATLTLPAGTTRFGFHSVTGGARDTYWFDQIAPPLHGIVPSVSTNTAQLLPALVGVSPTPGRSLVVGTARDCAGHLLSNAVAVLSSTPHAPTPLPGADVYYFSDTAGVPVRHTTAIATSRDALFLSVETPEFSDVYVQIWGFRTAAELATGSPTRIAERHIAVPGTAAVQVAVDPFVAF